jgi:hypothetical protein
MKKHLVFLFRILLFSIIFFISFITQIYASECVGSCVEDANNCINSGFQILPSGNNACPKEKEFCCSKPNIILQNPTMNGKGLNDACREHLRNTSFISTLLIGLIITIFLANFVAISRKKENNYIISFTNWIIFIIIILIIFLILQLFLYYLGIDSGILLYLLIIPITFISLFIKLSIRPIISNLVVIVSIYPITLIILYIIFILFSIISGSQIYLGLPMGVCL